MNAKIQKPRTSSTNYRTEQPALSFFDRAALGVKRARHGTIARTNRCRATGSLRARRSCNPVASLTDAGGKKTTDHLHTDRTRRVFRQQRIQLIAESIAASLGCQAPVDPVCHRVKPVGRADHIGKPAKGLALRHIGHPRRDVLGPLHGGCIFGPVLRVSLSLNPRQAGLTIPGELALVSVHIGLGCRIVGVGVGVVDFKLPVAALQNSGAVDVDLRNPVRTD